MGLITLIMKIKGGDETGIICLGRWQYSSSSFYCPAEVMIGKYWRLGVFLLPYSPLVIILCKIMYYMVAKSRGVVKIRNTSEAVLTPQYNDHGLMGLGRYTL